MKASLLLATALLAGCAAAPNAIPRPKSAAGRSLIDADRGTLAGSWRGVDPRLALSLMEIGGGRLTFSAQRGCTVTGGVLQPVGERGRYMIERYTSGFATSGCGPWRSGPELAPFDGTAVQLDRTGSKLSASGATGHATFDRMRQLDFTVRPERLYGSWRLVGGPSEFTDREKRTRLEFGPQYFLFASACNRWHSNGFVTLPGLRIGVGGDTVQQQIGECDYRTSGDTLVGALQQNILNLTYRPSDDRILAHLGNLTYELARD